MRIIIPIVAVSFLFTTSLFSDTIHVPDDYPTIQQAINASVNGDTVLVKPGMYVENIDFRGKAITLTSEQGPGVTIIDGMKKGSVVTFKTHETPSSILDGFTVRNGKGDYLAPAECYFGGGIFCLEAYPVITNNIIENNAVTQSSTYISRGGGIGCFKCSPRITGNVITGNFVKSGSGGGIALVESQSEVRGNTITKNDVDFWGSGIFCQDSPYLVIENNVISENKAGNNKSSGGRGAGITCYYSSPLISDNTLTANVTEHGNGGAMYFVYSESEVINNKISQNIAYGRGGGIMCNYESRPLIMNNTITDNEAKYGGGGICWKNDCTPTVADNVITGNSVWDGPGGGLFYDGIPPVANRQTVSGGDTTRGGYVVKNLISANTALEGGGIYFEWPGDHTISANVIEGNLALERGGGVSFGLSTPSFWNNLVSGNEAVEQGGGIFFGAFDSSICNNTVTGNTAGGEGGGIYVNFSEASAVNMILWNNSAAMGPEIAVRHSTFSIHDSDVAGGLGMVHLDTSGIIDWGPGMIDADPLFVDPAAGDRHLQYHSPCRDQGDNSCVMMIHDFEEDPRIAGGVVDMGMDEFYQHLYCTGAATPGGSIQGKLVGVPGASPVGLFIGSGIAPSGVLTPWGWFHLEWPYVLIGPLGTIPSTGVLVLPSVLPVSPPAPYDVPMQALVGLNPDSLTNLYVLEVR